MIKGIRFRAAVSADCADPSITTVATTDTATATDVFLIATNDPDPVRPHRPARPADFDEENKNNN